MPSFYSLVFYMSNFRCSPILISGTTKDKLGILWSKTLSYHSCSVKCTWLPFPCHQNPLHNATWVKIHWNLMSSTAFCFTALCFPIAELPAQPMGLIQSFLFFDSRDFLSALYVLEEQSWPLYILYFDCIIFRWQCVLLTHSYFLHMYKLYNCYNLKIFKNLHWKKI